MRHRKIIYGILFSAILVWSMAYAIPIKHRAFLLRGSGSISVDSGGATSGTSWATWNELAEAGWEGSSANTFIALMENAAVGNETGRGGGLAGADLVLTQAGSISGATGSPSYRQLTQNNDVLNWTRTAVETFVLDNTWTLIWKFADFTDPSDYGAASGQVCDLYGVGVGGENRLMLLVSQIGTGILDIRIMQNGNPLLVDVTADGINNAGNVYFAAWSDGTNIRAGFTTTRPTKLSHFDAGKVKAVATALTLTNVSARQEIVGSDDNIRGPTAKCYYVIVSKDCLIDNGS